MSLRSRTVSSRVTVLTACVMWPATVSSRNLYKARSYQLWPFQRSRLMRQQYATPGLGNEMLRHATENQFAESRMTVGAGDHDTRRDVGGYAVQLGYHVPTPIRHQLGGGNATTGQPRPHTPAPRHRGRPAVAGFHDLGDGDLLGLAKHRQGIGDRPPSLQRVLPGHQNASQIEPADIVRCNEQRPAGLHHQILRAGQRERVRKIFTLSAAHDDVGATRFLHDVPCREIDGAAPLDMPSAIFGGLAKLPFQLRYAFFDRCLALVDQILRLLPQRVIERRTELRRRDPDDPSLESLGNLAGGFETSLVPLIPREADHDGRICHPISPLSRPAGPSRPEIPWPG